MPGLMRLVWPITDEDLTCSELVAEAEAKIRDVCGRLRQVPVGMARDWEVRQLPEGGSVLRCVVPVMGEREARDSRIRDLHGQGLIDSRIAVRLGCAKSTVVRARGRLGLGPNSMRARMADSPALLAEVGRLLGEGFTDPQIGDVLGVSQPSVWRLRTTLGLPANGRGGVRRTS